MTPEISTTLFLEGASCSGKTYLLKTVADKDVAIILKNWPANLNNPPTEFFLERDEDKLARAKAAPEQIKLVDRAYLATLTFYKVLEEQEGVSAEPVVKWYINELGQKLYKPDHYIFVDVPGDVTKQRAKDCGRTMHDNNMWLKFPERINFWYNQLLAIYEPATSVYRIDGTQAPKVVEEQFKDLLSDLRKGLVK
ncbi:MAG: hypothetical protein UR98_C0018G0006 [Parcubacteria group bacterium GW2011_GWA1_36_12]|nr:MAG: hypothetical protein UR98_C0018G0006 [Parcubacteria group bacterium GW2011_GWA1_36_12]